MKKSLIFIAALAILAISAGCASNRGVQPSVQVPTGPAWVDEVPPEDVFYGIGIANLQNQNLAMQTAIARARRDVASQLSVLVQGMLIDYAREAGTYENSTSIQFIENVTRELVNANLSGASPDRRSQMNDKTWWVRVVLYKADAKKAINDVVDNEASRYAEFKADEALRMLDAQIDRAQSKPNPRSED